ncbi:hypothetical protein BDZ97DRAFT_1922642 [Flammula alnicola]|nr:hypothetical protein BDZ97DRAFT_1922642 [Flammula alnicola]
MSPNTFLKVIALSLMVSIFNSDKLPCIGTSCCRLGGAGNFVILAKSGISTVAPSKITGNLGLSPAAETFFTGFSLIRSSSGTTASSSQPDAFNPHDISNCLITAFNDAAGRLNPTAVDLGAGRNYKRFYFLAQTRLLIGTIGGLTFAPGIYKWSSNVKITTSITISGNSTDTWIFQVAGTLTMASGKTITLSGGALAKNIVWVASGKVAIGSTAVFNGVILGATAIVLNTGATLHGRILAQTAVTLQNAIVSS